MTITICLIYLFIAGMVAFNAYLGAKHTKARLTYITWYGAPRFTLRDSKGVSFLITLASGSWQNMEFKLL